MAVTLVERDGEQAGEALARLARHVPPQVEVGRVLAVFRDADENTSLVLTPVGLWTVHPAHVERLVSIGDGGLHELTLWFGGRETARFARRVAQAE